MEVLFMDLSFNTTRIIDAFTSLIWTDRYCGYGDFELRLPMTSDALSGIREGYYASIKESDRYMIVEGITIKTSNEEGNILIISGRSLESLLDRRIVRDDSILLGSIYDILQRLLNANSIYPKTSARTLPRLSMRKATGSIFSTQVEYAFEKGLNLYDAVVEICDDNKIGFRVVPGSNGLMYFELYSGVDRSYDQTKNPWVVFSPKFENLKDTEMIMNTEDLRTTAISDSTYTWTIVNSETQEAEEVEETITVEVGGNISGLDRREIYVAGNVTPEFVDKAAFGNAADRLNYLDYCTWDVVYFDKDRYDRDMEAYEKKVHDAWIPAREEEVTKTWIEYKPGEPGYIGDQPGVGPDDFARVNGYWKYETIPGETPEEARAKNKRWAEIIENERPDKENYYRYGWVFTDYDRYDRDLQEKQREIDAEYEAALNNSREVCRQALIGNASAKLAQYLSISSFDGDVDTNVQFIYKRDYDLGDLVQIVNEYNYQAVTRLVNVMFTEEDGEGVRIIPTFESDDKAVFSL